MYLLTCIQCDSLYVGKTKNILLTRMNGHRSSSNNPDNLTLPITIHTKQFPFIICWNICVLHNLPPNNNHITCCHLKLVYQFVLSFRHSTGVNFRWFLFNFPSISSPFLSCTHSGSTLPNLSNGAIFTVCSHTFTLLIEKDICDHQNISVKLSCVYLCLSSGDLSSFFW